MPARTAIRRRLAFTSGLAVAAVVVSAAVAGLAPSAVAGTPPDQVHLAWTKDPGTTMTLVWHTGVSSTPSTVNYRLHGTVAWTTVSGAKKKSGVTPGTMHIATITGLSPSTSYDYEILGDGGVWGPVTTFTTAPQTGVAGSFSFVYVADTSIAGRPDGLSAGVNQMLSVIESLHPLFVLNAGNFISRATDPRWPNQNAAEDAYFNQMQVLAADEPMMPAYGDHEREEGFSNWKPRWAQPTGSSDGLEYSFNVGNVHFVALAAYESSLNSTSTTPEPHSGGPMTSADLSWVTSDLAAAAANPAIKWIIPFYHVEPFGDGVDHASDLRLRKQLGPIFQKYGVKISLAAHDQNYQRTWPLINVPASNTPTTTTGTCYGPSDGTTYLTTSPGGKLSDQNKWFSTWVNTVPPFPTAFRDDTLFHLDQIFVSSTGTITVDVWGYPGTTGTAAPKVIDTFSYNLNGCP